MLCLQILLVSSIPQWEWVASSLGSSHLVLRLLLSEGRVVRLLHCRVLEGVAWLLRQLLVLLLLRERDGLLWLLLVERTYLITSETTVCCNVWWTDYSCEGVVRSCCIGGWSCYLLWLLAHRCKGVLLSILPGGWRRRNCAGVWILHARDKHVRARRLHLVLRWIGIWARKWTLHFWLGDWSCNVSSESILLGHITLRSHTEDGRLAVDWSQWSIVWLYRTANTAHEWRWCHLCLTRRKERTWLRARLQKWVRASVWSDSRLLNLLRLRLLRKLRWSWLSLFNSEGRDRRLSGYG